jgi:hypothetical protein
LGGVREVEVALQPEGVSEVTVTSDVALERRAVRSAVTAAGYRLA